MCKMKDLFTKVNSNCTNIEVGRTEFVKKVKLARCLRLNSSLLAMSGVGDPGQRILIIDHFKSNSMIMRVVKNIAKPSDFNMLNDYVTKENIDNVFNYIKGNDGVSYIDILKIDEKLREYFLVNLFEENAIGNSTVICNNACENTIFNFNITIDLMLPTVEERYASLKAYFPTIVEKDLNRLIKSTSGFNYDKFDNLCLTVIKEKLLAATTSEDIYSLKITVDDVMHLIDLNL